MTAPQAWARGAAGPDLSSGVRRPAPPPRAGVLAGDAWHPGPSSVPGWQRAPTDTGCSGCLQRLSGLYVMGPCPLLRQRLQLSAWPAQGGAGGRSGCLTTVPVSGVGATHFLPSPLFSKQLTGWVKEATVQLKEMPGLVNGKCSQA